MQVDKVVKKSYIALYDQLVTVRRIRLSRIIVKRGLKSSVH